MSGEIGTLNEKPLHAALKAAYAQPGDRTEVRVDGWVIDIVRGGDAAGGAGGDLLIEVQTRHVTAIRKKLADLAARHPVRLVIPIAQEKWIVRLAEDGETVVGRRRSPKRGSVESVFDELVSIPTLLALPNFSLEVALIQEEEIRHPDSTVNWRRRGWAVRERRLLGIVSQRVFETPADLAALLPDGLPEQFTTRGLARSLGRPMRLAQRMAYCLREMGILRVVGRVGRSQLYARGDAGDERRKTIDGGNSTR